MSTILNIETSSDTCSVAIGHEGDILFHLEETAGMKHAEVLAPFVEKCMNELLRRNLNLDAVAVSIGPGSYTGLRIGLSLAKGICFGSDIKLIGIPTLEILAVSAMFRNIDWHGDELLVPMLDARRMEVYTAVYDFSLNAIKPPHPLVLTPDSFSELLSNNRLYIMGNGSDKAKGIIKSPNILHLNDIKPLAIDMLALSERAMRQENFLDIAYSTPEYLKEFMATTPRNPFEKG